MYGYNGKEWEYIWKNRDFSEVFVPSKNGHAKAKARKLLYEELGHEVFPYEDSGVSVGIFVMRKEQE